MVIPLERLADISDGIERINIELSIKNKLALCDALLPYLQGSLPVDRMGTDLPSSELLGERANHRIGACGAGAGTLAMAARQPRCAAGRL